MCWLDNTSAQSVTGGSDGIHRVRNGAPRHLSVFGAHPWAEGYDPLVVPTFHPAACLRQGDSFPSFVTDLGKVKDALTTGTTIHWEPPTYRVFDEANEACQALRQLLRSYRDIVLDIEVGVEK